ncbi:unnamed protein product [Orchesella dallaii]|uniref:Uncharacterized protein n=1 Tax=Orchesella dallaii TaxID=48710 RepID=A0ABP1QKY9_9HEXA
MVLQLKELRYYQVVLFFMCTIALLSEFSSGSAIAQTDTMLTSTGENLTYNATESINLGGAGAVSYDTSFESSEEDSEEDSDEDEDGDGEEEIVDPKQIEPTEQRHVILEETKIVHLAHGQNSGDIEKTALNETLGPVTHEPFHVAIPLPVRQKDEPDLFSPDEAEDALLNILQNSVKETYLAFKRNAARKKMDDLQHLEDSLKGQIQNLDIDLNAKILALDTNANSRISTLTEQIVSQRNEDIVTFSDNLNQLSKANQVHLETLHADTQHLKVTVEGLNKGQASLSAKMSQLQKTMHNMELKVNEIAIKNMEDMALLQTTQKTLAVLVDSMEKDLRSSEAALDNIQNKIGDLEKAKTEDSNKLRKTMIRDQKQDPLQTCVRHLKNKNVGGALKQWRMIEQITEDLKETLPADITKIIEDGYSKSPMNLPQMAEFVHRAVSHGERRLKEAAYSTLLTKMEQAKHLADRRKILEVFHVAQRIKSDLGSFYNTSAATADIVSKLPEPVRLVTFDKVKLFLPSRGFLRVSADRKVSLLPKDARFYDKDEILWQFDYDMDKTDGTFYIRSDKLQKYLVTIHEGFNSYGFSRQALFMTGNRKENGTRFDISNINGDNVLLKSIFYNGYLTWKSNIQTIYGDDDSYFVLLEDRKNGPSPYWEIKPENEF